MVILQTDSFPWKNWAHNPTSPSDCSPASPCLWAYQTPQHRSLQNQTCGFPPQWQLQPFISTSHFPILINFLKHLAVVSRHLHSLTALWCFLKIHVSYITSLAHPLLQSYPTDLYIMIFIANPQIALCHWYLLMFPLIPLLLQFLLTYLLQILGLPLWGSGNLTGNT